MNPPGSAGLLAAILATIAVVAACSGGAATPASPAAASAPIATPSAAPAATPTAPPAAPTPAPTPSAVAPTTYRGTVKGGGTIEFTVSPDGSKLTAFVTEYPSCYGGTFHVSMLNSDVPEAVITAGVFTFGSPSFARVRGRLLSGGTAEGTIEEDTLNVDIDACKVRRVYTWSATVSSAAAPTPAPTPSAVAPTTYRGTVKGGGTIDFTVSPDGSKLTAFVTEYPCSGGIISVSMLNSGVPEAVITAGVFTFGPPSSVRVTGRLLSGGSAEGTIEHSASATITACKVRTVSTWSATVDP